MPSFDNHISNGNALVDTPCQGPAAPEEPNGPQPCDCKKDIRGPVPKSMMDGKFAPQEDGKFAPQDDGKFAPQDDGKCAPKSMMDGKFAPQDGKAPCQKHLNGQDDKSVPAPMMDGKETKQDLPLPGQ